jgi:hypothetical protein
MIEVLKKIWSGWKWATHRFARFQTLVLLTLFYFLILVPVGAVFRLFGWDPLRTSRRQLSKGTNWQAVKEKQPDLKSMHRMS